MPFNKDNASPSPMTAALRAAGYSLKAAAGEMGVSYQHLSNIARGRTHASGAVIEGFADLTGKPLSDFVPEWVLSKPYDPSHRPANTSDSRPNVVS